VDNAGLISTKLCCADERMISNDMCTVLISVSNLVCFGFEFHAETEAEYWAVTARS
jgi:hypothetical protein